ncbi:MAG TPA: zinc ribbon domain-containing protein [Opitutaceae bacterium]
MPLRAYEPLQPPCRLCGQGFEILEPASAPALEACPRCGAGVRLKAVAPLNTPKVTRPSSITDAKAAGFTVLKRTAGGEYEKQ